MANEVPQKSEAEVVAKLAVDGRLLHTIGIGDNRVVLGVPAANGTVIAQSVKGLLQEYADRPERIVGTSTHFTLASFIDYVNRQKNPASAVFLDPNASAPKIVAVIDYHDKPTPPANAAHFGKHRAHYAFPLSDEWEKWSKQNGQAMTQEAFAAWLEDHVMDVLDPENTEPEVKAFANKLGMKFADGSTLISLSRGLTINIASQMTKVVNLASGEATMNFVEEHKDAGGQVLKIPGAFAIAIPVFKGGERKQLAVRLRYRAGGGRVTWYFEIYQQSRVFDAAIESARQEVERETELDTFTGTPEQ
jgi:uncharacterized protein YfdQ (DUF2303 family)